jgi:hypothetical protein
LTINYRLKGFSGEEPKMLEVLVQKYVLVNWKTHQVYIDHYSYE